jgi:hypothetical protein
LALLTFSAPMANAFAFQAYLFKGQIMDKEDIYDILAAVAIGLMLAFFLTVRG